MLHQRPSLAVGRPLIVVAVGPQYAEPHQWNETSYTAYVDKFVSEMAGAGAGPDVLCEPPRCCWHHSSESAINVAANRRRLLSVLRVSVRLQPEHLDRGLPRRLGRSALRFTSRQHSLLERETCLVTLPLGSIALAASLTPDEDRARV